MHENQSNDKKLAAQLARLSPAKRALLESLTEKGKVNGHFLVAQTLKKLGITHVYALSGTPIDQTMGACVTAGIRVLGARHQQAAVMMALAHNYRVGRLTAICIVSCGPAVTNAVTGVLVAKDDSWPVIVLGGRRPLQMQNMGGFQDLDAVPIFQSITKWSAVVENTADLPGHIERAFHTAIQGRPGPVYLDLPEDILNGKITQPDTLPDNIQSQQCPEISQAAIEQAADILINAQRPALIIGKGVRWSEPYQELQQLVDHLAMPFICSPMGKGYLPDDHPLCFNGIPTEVQSTADAVLVVGARLNWPFRFGTALAQDTKLIHIDIEKSEIGHNVNATLGLCGDSKKILEKILINLLQKQKVSKEYKLRESWFQTLKEKRKNRELKLEQLWQVNGDDKPMSTHRMCKEIRDFIPRDAVCVVDGNIIMAAVQQVIPSYLPASRLTAGSNGCMGIAIPYAIGVKLAEPDRMVIAITGDSAFGFNAMEMEMAMRHDIPIIVIIADNQGISGSYFQNKNYPPDHERVTMYPPDIRNEEVVKAFGCHTDSVDKPEQLIPALKRAVESGLPSCINVHIDPDAPLFEHMG